MRFPTKILFLWGKNPLSDAPCHYFIAGGSLKERQPLQKPQFYRLKVKGGEVIKLTILREGVRGMGY